MSSVKDIRVCLDEDFGAKTSGKQSQLRPETPGIADCVLLVYDWEMLT